MELSYDIDCFIDHLQSSPLDYSLGDVITHLKDFYLEVLHLEKELATSNKDICLLQENIEECRDKIDKLNEEISNLEDG